MPCLCRNSKWSGNFTPVDALLAFDVQPLYQMTFGAENTSSWSPIRVCHDCMKAEETWMGAPNSAWCVEPPGEIRRNLCLEHFGQVRQKACAFCGPPRIDLLSWMAQSSWPSYFPEMAPDLLTFQQAWSSTLISVCLFLSFSLSLSLSLLVSLSHLSVCLSASFICLSFFLYVCLSVFLPVFFYL